MLGEVMPLARGCPPVDRAYLIAYRILSGRAS